MTFELLKSVVLARDLPEHGLKKGDVGAIVEMYPPDGLEVEFVRASGKPQAVVAVQTADIRRMSDDDLIAIRRLDEPR